MGLRAWTATTLIGTKFPHPVSNSQSFSKYWSTIVSTGFPSAPVFQGVVPPLLFAGAPLELLEEDEFVLVEEPELADVLVDPPEEVAEVELVELVELGSPEELLLVVDEVELVELGSPDEPEDVELVEVSHPEDVLDELVELGSQLEVLLVEEVLVELGSPEELLLVVDEVELVEVPQPELVVDELVELGSQLDVEPVDDVELGSQEELDALLVDDVELVEVSPQELVVDELVELGSQLEVLLVEEVLVELGSPEELLLVVDEVELVEVFQPELVVDELVELGSQLDVEPVDDVELGSQEELDVVLLVDDVELVEVSHPEDVVEVLVELSSQEELLLVVDEVELVELGSPEEPEDDELVEVSQPELVVDEPVELGSQLDVLLVDDVELGSPDELDVVVLVDDVEFVEVSPQELVVDELVELGVQLELVVEEVLAELGSHPDVEFEVVELEVAGVSFSWEFVFLGAVVFVEVFGAWIVSVSFFLFAARIFSFTESSFSSGAGSVVLGEGIIGTISSGDGGITAWVVSGSSGSSHQVNTFIRRLKTPGFSFGTDCGLSAVVFVFCERSATWESICSTEPGSGDNTTSCPDESIVGRISPHHDPEGIIEPVSVSPLPLSGVVWMRGRGVFKGSGTELSG